MKIRLVEMNQCPDADLSAWFVDEKGNRIDGLAVSEVRRNYNLQRVYKINKEAKDLDNALYPVEFVQGFQDVELVVQTIHGKVSVRDVPTEVSFEEHPDGLAVFIGDEKVENLKPRRDSIQSTLKECGYSRCMFGQPKIKDESCEVACYYISPELFSEKRP
jgi:hypothetical protein